jgi:hypothetical protein
MTGYPTPEFHCCGLPIQSCAECGEPRCYACDPYRPERDCGSGALLIEVAS